MHKNILDYFCCQIKKTDYTIFTKTIIIFLLTCSGAVFTADSHAGSDPKSLIVASARPVRSDTADNGSIVSLPGDSGKSTKQTKTSPQTISFKAEDRLPGVIYDFSRTAAGRPTDLLEIQNISNPNEFDFNVLPLLRKFILGSWTRMTNSNGKIVFPELSQLYSPDVTPYRSSFYKPTVLSKTWGLDYTENTISKSGYCVIHSGYVVAPFTGKFRFVGYGNDVAAIRFNRQIVLDYGCFSLTLGKHIASPNEYRTLVEQNSKGRLLPEKDIYSGKLETYFPNQCDDYGIAKGPAINVVKGQVYPVDIIYVDIKGSNSSIAIFVEQLDSNGRPLKNNPKKLPLFRTSSELPDHPDNNTFSDFEDDGPIWKVVDSSGKPIPASKYAKQDVKAGLQLDDGIDTKQQTVASATTTKPKTVATAVNEEDELPGVLYDLKQTADGSPTYLMDLQGGKQFNRLRTTLSVWNLPDTADTESIMVPYLKRFVLSNWPHKTDSAGVPSYNEFSKFSRSSVIPYNSYFYQPMSDNAPKTFYNNNEISDTGWVGINSGYVVAPFTGKFRFVGFGDDVLVVRFNNQLVLDYGWYVLSLGKRLDDSWDYKGILGGTAARTDPQNRLLLENPIYSQCKLEAYFPSKCANRGLAKGIPISVIKGRCYPIEILVPIIEGGGFSVALFMERLDSDGTPLKKEPAKLPLFRTSSRLPNHSSGDIPDFDDDSPIWKIVNSNGKPIPSHKQGSKLVVTTAKDVVNPNDGLTSIREAISYAKSLGGVQTISFNMSDGDNVTISDPALVYHDLRFASSNEATGNAVTVTLDKLKISGRTITTSGVSDSNISGGTILHTKDANIKVSGGTYSNNQNIGQYGWGGVIRMRGGGSLIVDGVIFDSNRSGDSGGAINCHGPNVTIRNTHFKNNTASLVGGGGIILWELQNAYLVDTDFVSNSELNNKNSSGGGAIHLHEADLVYEVTEGKTITNIDNESEKGGFISLSGEWANAEFKVNGTLFIGNGNGKDSIASQDSSSKKMIRKTGSGKMTINAATSPFNGNWIVEDGVLDMNYGGNFAGMITIKGGRMVFSKDYTMTKLVVELDTKKKDAYIGGTSHLSGGKYYIVIDDAIQKGSYLLADDVNKFNTPVTVQNKSGTPLGTLVVGRETIISDGNCMLTLDGGKLSLSVLSPINPVKKANTDENPNAQPQRDPNLKKVVSTTTSGNITTQTVTEYNGDTTIETVTTTEVNGDTTTTTTTTTETKNGAIVKKTTTTTTTTTTGNQSASQSSTQSETEKAAGNSSSETNTTPKKNNPTYNPFGYTSPLMED